MNARLNLIQLVLIPVCLSVASCSQPMTRATQLETAPTKLVFEKILLDSNKKLFTAFADVNGDAKLDLILGSNGHEFFDAAPRVRISEKYDGTRNFVSHLLNKSSGDDFEFDEPYWPNSHGEDGQLPGG